jgi:hypothetical protein
MGLKKSAQHEDTTQTTTVLESGISTLINTETTTEQGRTSATKSHR